MTTITKSEIELRGTDAMGKFAMVNVGGEWVGVSIAGEDECVRDLDDIEVGMRVECGVEVFEVVKD